MNIAEKIKSIFTKSEICTKSSKIKSTDKFADITLQVIDKIKRTPCWQEFSQDSKEKMISKYFDKKIKTSAYIGVPYNNKEKQIFIKEVLKSVV